MINKRRLRREQRYEQFYELTEWIKDLHMESAFERQLRRSDVHIDPVFSDDLSAWCTCSLSFLSLAAHVRADATWCSTALAGEAADRAKGEQEGL